MYPDTALFPALEVVLSKMDSIQCTTSVQDSLSTCRSVCSLLAFIQSELRKEIAAIGNGGKNYAIMKVYIYL